jgi:hypothetical protein
VRSRSFALLLASSLTAAAVLPAAVPAAATDTADRGPAGAAVTPVEMDALTVLPPGNSMRYTLEGRRAGR